MPLGVLHRKCARKGKGMTPINIKKNLSNKCNILWLWFQEPSNRIYKELLQKNPHTCELFKLATMYDKY